MNVTQETELAAYLMRSFTKNENQAKEHCKFGLQPATSNPGTQQWEIIYEKNI